MSQVKAIDLFCGAGGLTYGLEKAGITVTEGIDIEGACKYAFEENTKARFVPKDVLEYSASDVKSAFKGADVSVLAGCAPCQPFSTYAQGPRGKGGDKWALLKKFISLVEETLPDVVSMENVTPLERTNTFREFSAAVRLLGYKVTTTIVDCRDYGVPQSRRRLVLLASRLGDINLISETHMGKWLDVKSAIGKLPSLAAGARDSSDPLHRASTLSATNLKRIRASVPGGSWKDWPQSLRAECHKKTTGKTYPSVYGRMRWDEPAPTITGQCFGFGNGRFGHPEQDRAISLREAALLQSFPEQYKFEELGKELPMKAVGRMIGNAVPPRLGEVIGASILAHVAR